MLPIPMQLSTVPLRGARLVRASRLLRVLHPHDVSTQGAASLDLRKVTSVPGAAPIPQGPAQAGQPRARAVEGDLALEVVDGKTGEVIGYSYLSGHAIQCMGYELAPHRFEPGLYRRLTDVEQVIARGVALTGDDDPAAPEIYREMIERLQAAKHGDADVVGLEVQAGKHCGNLVQAILKMWGATRVDQAPPPDARAHLLATIWNKKRAPSFLRKRKNEVAFFHAQPARHASDHAATPFQHQLVLTLPPAPPI